MFKNFSSKLDFCSTQNQKPQKIPSNITNYYILYASNINVLEFFK